MAIEIPSNFGVQTTLPIDDRMTVADATARNAIPQSRRYEGLRVYVAADQITYQLEGGTNDIDWTPLNSANSLIDGGSWS